MILKDCKKRRRKGWGICHRDASGPQSLKYLLSGHLPKKFEDPCFKQRAWLPLVPSALIVGEIWADFRCQQARHSLFSSLPILISSRSKSQLGVWVCLASTTNIWESPFQTKKAGHSIQLELFKVLWSAQESCMAQHPTSTPGLASMLSLMLGSPEVYWTLQFATYMLFHFNLGPLHLCLLFLEYFIPGLRWVTPTRPTGLYSIIDSHRTISVIYRQPIYPLSCTHLCGSTNETFFNKIGKEVSLGNV